MGNNYEADRLQENDDDIITLLTADGDEVDFKKVIEITHLFKKYYILQPFDIIDGVGEDEALVFKVKKDKDGCEHFNVELNDRIVDAVFKKYNKIMDKRER